MRLWTIWTLPACTIGEKLRRTREWSAQTVAQYLIPKRVRYWVTIQEIARATMESPNVPATHLDEILTKLDRPKVVS